MLFNVYYMNFSKVYEIKMMLSNIIKTDGSIENLQGNTRDADIHAKLGTKFLSIFNSGGWRYKEWSDRITESARKF